MPHFQVLRCYVETCGIFQSQQVKKTPKWQCKVCGEKQSVKRVYFDSENAKDCRQAVQQLNLKRKDVDERRGLPGFYSSTDSNDSSEFPSIQTESTQKIIQAQLENSKWNTYASEESETEESYGPEITTDMSILETLKRTRKPRKKRTLDTQPSKTGLNEARSRRRHPNTLHSNNQKSLLKEHNVISETVKADDHSDSSLGKRSKWADYEEAEESSEQEECHNSPLNNVTKPKNTALQLSKWSTYMQEEEEEGEDSVYAHSYTSQAKSPSTSLHTGNEPRVNHINSPSSSSKTICSSSDFQQDNSVDIRPCTISSKTKVRLSQFTFTKSRSTIQTKDRPSSHCKFNSPNEGLYSNPGKLSTDARDQSNDIDALEIDEIDPFTV